MPTFTELSTTGHWIPNVTDLNPKYTQSIRKLVPVMTVKVMVIYFAYHALKLTCISLRMDIHIKRGSFSFPSQRLGHTGW